MGGHEDSLRRPGVWHWAKARGDAPFGPLTITVLGLVALSVQAALDGNAVAFAYAGAAAALVLYPLMSWHGLRRSAPLSLEVPPPAEDTRRLSPHDLPWQLLTIPLWLVIVLDPWREAWPRRVLPAIALLLLSVLAWLWLWWTARRRQSPRDLSPLPRLQQDLRARWPSLVVHATSAAGHATMTFDTSEGPELVWYLHCEKPSNVLPEMVLLMDRQLDAYDLTRGWIVTRASWSAALADFAEGFDILFAQPDHFAERPAVPTGQPVREVAG